METVFPNPDNYINNLTPFKRILATTALRVGAGYVGLIKEGGHVVFPYGGAPSQRTVISEKNINMAPTTPRQDEDMQIEPPPRIGAKRIRSVSMGSLNSVKRKLKFAKRPIGVRRIRKRGRGKARRGTYKRGSYTGKRVRQNKFAIDGTVQKYECGGVVEDNDCVYVGMGTCPIRQMSQGICRAIVKELFAQMGYAIPRWDEAFVWSGTHYAYKIEFYYLPTVASAAEASFASDFITGESYLTISNKLEEALTTRLMLYPCLTLQKFRLAKMVTIAGDLNVDWCASIDSSQFTIDMMVYGDLAVQNRTAASDNPAHDQSTDIQNNPVIGKVYFGSGNSFVPKDIQDNPGYQPFLVGSLAPDFKVRAVDNNESITRKPISGRDLLGVVKTSPITIDPGVIRKVILKFSKKMNLTKFYQAYGDAIVNGGVHKLGKLAMIGIEKMLNDRVSLSKVSLGYEVNLNIRIAGKYRRKTSSIALTYVQPHA